MHQVLALRQERRALHGGLGERVARVERGPPGPGHAADPSVRRAWHTYTCSRCFRFGFGAQCLPERGRDWCDCASETENRHECGPRPKPPRSLMRSHDS